MYQRPSNTIALDIVLEGDWCCFVKQLTVTKRAGKYNKIKRIEDSRIRRGTGPGNLKSGEIRGLYCNMFHLSLP